MFLCIADPGRAWPQQMQGLDIHELGELRGLLQAAPAPINFVQVCLPQLHTFAYGKMLNQTSSSYRARSPLSPLCKVLALLRSSCSVPPLPSCVNPRLRVNSLSALPLHLPPPYASCVLLRQSCVNSLSETPLPLLPRPVHLRLQVVWALFNHHRGGRASRGPHRRNWHKQPYSDQPRFRWTLNRRTATAYAGFPGAQAQRSCPFAPGNPGLDPPPIQGRIL